MDSRQKEALWFVLNQVMKIIFKSELVLADSCLCFVLISFYVIIDANLSISIYSSLL